MRGGKAQITGRFFYCFEHKKGRKLQNSKLSLIICLSTYHTSEDTILAQICRARLIVSLVGITLQKSARASLGNGTINKVKQLKRFSYFLGALLLRWASIVAAGDIVS